MDTKIIFGVIGTVISISAYIPYVRDIFKRKTQPHIYTWFIWAITQGFATVGILYGGGNWGALGLASGTVLILFTFFISLKYGSKNITKSDTILFGSVLLAILLWIVFKSPLPAILAITIIDTLAYIPTWRKVFGEPWSETLSSWIAFTIGNFFAIAAMREYNFLTLPYLITINIANIVLIIICILRRSNQQKPLPHNQNFAKL